MPLLVLLLVQSMLTDFAAVDQSKRQSVPLSLQAWQIVLHIRFLVEAIKSNNKAASADQSGGECNRTTTATSCTTLRAFALAGSNAFSGAALVNLVTPG